MPKKSIRTPSENEILKFLLKQHSKADVGVKRGIGDDAAVLSPGKSGEYRLVTTDMLVEDIDFRLEWSSPLHLGRKSLAVNFSDIAAMGGQPRFYTVSLGLPQGLSRNWITEFYRGLTQQGLSYGASLIGGDLSSTTGKIVISITVLGESVGRKVLYRSGGREGDILYVTGILGRSAAGLKILEGGHLHPKSRMRLQAIQSHLQPEPRCEAGKWLAHCGYVRCMMDLSDGLSADLPRLCAASGISAEVDISILPLFNQAADWGMNPVDLALHGGEDFELLFAVKKSKSSIFEKTYPENLTPVARIGKMIHGKGTVWVYDEKGKRRRLENKGYDHFNGTIQ